MLLLLQPVAASAQESTSDPVMATVGTVEIRASEVDAVAQVRLRAIRAQEYSVRKSTLDELIRRALLTNAARARDVSVDELLTMEIDGKVSDVTDEEALAAMSASPERYAGKQRSEAVKAAGTALRSQRLSARFREFTDDLRRRSDVATFLDAPRVAVTSSGAPSLGASDARVTVVVFSDFQCPFCGKMAPIVRSVAARYSDRVRFAFKNFPLGGHPDAAKAAEAALCAGEQNRFWEMHDVLFKNQQQLGVGRLRGYARSLGLDSHRFDDCIDSARQAAVVRRDASEGDSYGVAATPTTFVNGSLLVGALSFEALSQAIDDELARQSR
jgi:protein-disulfide isomerase